MAWFLVGMAWWFQVAKSRPTQRQINQERTVRQLAGLVRAAEKTGMAFAVLPGKEYDDVLVRPCKRSSTQHNGNRPA